MSPNESLAELWNYIDDGRGRETVSNLVQSWLDTRIERPGSISPDLLYALVDKRLDGFDGEHSTPKALNSFISKLASVHPSGSIMDPTCGWGLLLDTVATSTGAQIVHGVDINSQCCGLAEAVLGPKASIFCGDVFATPFGLQPNYDLIVAKPPFGLRMRGSPSPPYLAYTGDMGHTLALWACDRLSADGVAMVILTPGFLFNGHAGKTRDAIAKLGCRIRALIHLPGGTFPHTRIGTYLVVFERGTQGDVFIGEFADDLEHQRALVSNYVSSRAGDQPSRGRVCSLSGFMGFTAFTAQQRLKRLVKATGWASHPAQAVILNANRLDRPDPVDEKVSNSVVLKLIGRPEARLDGVDMLPQRAREYVRLATNPEVVDARYLVHWFNESLVGQTTLAAVSYEGNMTRIDVAALLAATIYLPPLSDQRSAIEAVEHLNRLRAEAEELENALWSSTEFATDVADRIRTINQQDRYEDWIESLPFPLASILWRHRAGGGGVREQYEVLLHFFEATAAFVATIHLSAFMADDSLWSETAQGMRDSLAKQHLSLERATFGAWKAVAEYLSGRCRALLADAAGVETCQRVYGTSNLRHVNMICHPELLAALQKANSIRNSTSGHGGAIGQQEAMAIHDELLALVHKIRGVFGRAWLDYELIQPAESRYREGVYHYGAKRLMGTRSAPFEAVQRESTLPLESDRLYLFDAIGQKGMLVRPFVRVMPSPEIGANACFIFSRCERAGVRFVSYHFEHESSVTGLYPDIDESFQRLHAFDEGATR